MHLYSIFGTILIWVSTCFASVSVQPISDSLYIKVDSFKSGTITQDTQAQLTQYPTEQARQVLIDLRNNPGGRIHDAIGFSALFVTHNALLWVETQAKKPLLITRPETHPFYTTKRLIIIINGNTASSAEAATHILMQHPNSIVIGSKSYGKTDIKSVSGTSPYRRLLLPTPKITPTLAMQLLEHSAHTDDILQIMQRLPN
jgi:carboxyl-terminal processing protease